MNDGEELRVWESLTMMARTWVSRGSLDRDSWRGRGQRWLGGCHGSGPGDRPGWGEGGRSSRAWEIGQAEPERIAARPRLGLSTAAGSSRGRGGRPVGGRSWRHKLDVGEDRGCR